jgi:Cu/Ag efflux protein CusF
MKALAVILTAAFLLASGAWAPETSAQTTAPAAPAPSMAKEVEGKVKSVDMAKKTIVLEDGTSLMVKDAAELKDVKPGSTIKASYSEQGGQKIANKLDVK